VDAPVLIWMMLSSVDNQTATDILNNLSQGTQRKTVIFISHQLSAAATAVFCNGQGADCQSGTHVELSTTRSLPDALESAPVGRNPPIVYFVGADFINKTVIQLFPHLIGSGGSYQR